MKLNKLKKELLKTWYYANKTFLLKNNLVEKMRLLI